MIQVITFFVTFAVLVIAADAEANIILDKAEDSL
jgi:hypothetical protein